MSQLTDLTNGAAHQTYHLLRRTVGHVGYGPEEHGAAVDRDRGAVSLEQVMWFVAAGIAVAAIAALLWSRVQAEAEKPLPANDPLG